MDGGAHQVSLLTRLGQAQTNLGGANATNNLKIKACQSRCLTMQGWNTGRRRSHPKGARPWRLDLL